MSLSSHGFMTKSNRYIVKEVACVIQEENETSVFTTSLSLKTKQFNLRRFNLNTLKYVEKYVHGLLLTEDFPGSVSYTKCENILKKTVQYFKVDTIIVPEDSPSEFMLYLANKIKQPNTNVIKLRFPKKNINYNKVCDYHKNLQNHDCLRYERYCALISATSLIDSYFSKHK